MFEKALFGNTKELLALLSRSRLLKDAYLGGGTALALQLGHRISIDLDFFTPRQFDARTYAKQFIKLKNFKVTQTSKGTLLGHFGEIKFSLFIYDYPVLYPFKRFLNIKLLDVRDIAAMKIAAICDRGTKRDFIDLYFICEKYSLPFVLKEYNRKYGKLESNRIVIYKSLVYFEDAEQEDTRKLLRNVVWNNVKNFFIN